MDELDELRKEEMLYAPDIYENVIDFVDAREPVVKALCLHIAHDCNLNANTALQKKASITATVL